MLGPVGAQSGLTYPIVDTNQLTAYDNTKAIAFPSSGLPFHGQDAQCVGTLPAYRDNGDGTVTDLNTGLVWQKSPDFQTLRTWNQAVTYAASLVLAGKSDWRLPTVKELYSLIDFRGSSVAQPPVPYIDTRFFDFQYPRAGSGLRLIDVQFWSATTYVGTTMNNDPTRVRRQLRRRPHQGLPPEEHLRTLRPMRSRWQRLRCEPIRRQQRRYHFRSGDGPDLDEGRQRQHPQLGTGTGLHREPDARRQE